MSQIKALSHLSVTYHHLAAVLASEWKTRPEMQARAIRILDLGCGNGVFLSFLQSALPELAPGIEFELYGLDVTDSNVQQDNYFSGTLNRLGSDHPGIDWKNRLVLTTAGSTWPFQNSFFDFVVSNQVLEHVRDHNVLFCNISRVLKDDGLSAHLFPLKTVFWELHVKAPFAHWWSDGDRIKSWLEFCSWLGLSTWRRYCKMVKPIGLSDYASMNRDFIVHETNYLTEDEFWALSKKHALRQSLRYTEEFYFNRLRRLAGRSLNYAYHRRGGLLHLIATTCMQRINGVTLILEKNNTYKNIGLHTPGR